MQLSLIVSLAAVVTAALILEVNSEVEKQHSSNGTNAVAHEAPKKTGFVNGVESFLRNIFKKVLDRLAKHGVKLPAFLKFFSDWVNKESQQASNAGTVESSQNGVKVESQSEKLSLRSGHQALEGNQEVSTTTSETKRPTNAASKKAVLENGEENDEGHPNGVTDDSETGDDSSTPADDDQSRASPLSTNPGNKRRRIRPASNSASKPSVTKSKLPTPMGPRRDSPSMKKPGQKKTTMVPKKEEPEEYISSSEADSKPPSNNTNGQPGSDSSVAAPAQPSECPNKRDGIRVYTCRNTCQENEIAVEDSPYWHPPGSKKCKKATQKCCKKYAPLTDRGKAYLKEFQDREIDEQSDVDNIRTPLEDKNELLARLWKDDGIPKPGFQLPNGCFRADIRVTGKRFDLIDVRKKTKHDFYLECRVPGKAGEQAWCQRTYYLPKMIQPKFFETFACATTSYIYAHDATALDVS